MDKLNSEILRQFERQGLTIHEGVAVDARLVKSASHLHDKAKRVRFTSITKNTSMPGAARLPIISERA